MRKKVTSTDIAKAAGVSQATVSMVLNKKYNVSDRRVLSYPDKSLLCHAFTGN